MEANTTPKKQPKKSTKDLEKLSTATIIWHVVKRHKFGLVSTWAAIVTTLYLFPTAPAALISLF